MPGFQTHFIFCLWQCRQAIVVYYYVVQLKMMLMLEHVIIIINCERAIKEWSLTKNILAIMVVIPLLSLWYFCWPATLTMDNFNIILMLHSNFAHTNLVHAYPIWNSSAVDQVRVINKPNKPCALTEYGKSVHFWLEGGVMCTVGIIRRICRDARTLSPSTDDPSFLSVMVDNPFDSRSFADDQLCRWPSILTSYHDRRRVEEGYCILPLKP